MQIVTILSGLLAAWTIYTIFRFIQSYRIAKSIGLPVVLTPVNFHSTSFRILCVPLRPIFQKYLPTWLAFRLELGTYGAEFVLREKTLRWGPNFVLCGPGALQVWTADSGVCTSVLQKPREYPPSAILQQIVNLVGQNLVGSNGDSWQRQRKIIAPIINERISGATWEESSRQAQSMVQIYTAMIEGNDTSIKGLKQLAFNVLAAVGYGKPRAWQDPAKEVADSQSTFINTIFLLVENMVAGGILPTKLLTSPVMPAFLQKTGKAIQDFPQMTNSLMDEERENGSTSNNLMAAMVKILDQEKEDSKLTLAPDEVTGNLLIFSIAGYDTTANTLAYALTLLAIYPEWQEWVREEIDEVARGPQDYTTVFPQLTRLLALMFETLRLFPPLIHSLRETHAPVSFTTEDGTTAAIPSDMEVQLTFGIVHISPDYWGKDALEFKPSRWIKPDGTMMTPAKGTFMPWSAGPRVCPGMKMAQVEFTAVLYTICRQCKIEPVLEKSESLDQARKRLNATMMDSGPVVTLQMNRPQDVKLRWTRREESTA